MDPLLTIAVVGALIVLVAAWRLTRHATSPRKPDNGRPGGSAGGVDTVAGWMPEPTRVMTGAERRAYTLLSRALPEHIVLAQVPLSRFMRVPTRHSYSEWIRRVGHLCADLLVCDASSQVVTVVDIRGPASKETDRTRRRHTRMDRVLREAGIRVVAWNEESLPAAHEVREQVLGSGYGAATAPPSAIAAASVVRQASATMPTVQDSLDDFATTLAAGRTDFQEPPPSTWFDDLELQPTAPRPETSR